MKKSHCDNLFLPQMAKIPKNLCDQGVYRYKIFSMQKNERMLYLQFETKKTLCDNLFLPQMAKIPVFW